jgi:kynureninase
MSTSPLTDPFADTAVDPLVGYRELFPVLRASNYLISNSLGAVPTAAFEAARDYVELWAERGVRAWEERWWEMSETVGDHVAPLIGAGPGEVVFQPNVTLGHAIVFSCFDYHAGRPKVVSDAMHFPSVLYLLDQQRAFGAEVEIVPTDDGVTVDTARLLAAIDERTAFVNVSHVLFKSAYIHDVAAICERARQVGAVTIIDGYQAVGTLPVDVAALGADVYLGGCLKWLCGGPGAAFLWVRPELRPSLTPRLTGWLSHARPFDFAPTLQRRSDAWRFLTGTPNISALYIARPGLDIIGEVGPAAIRAKSRHQTSRLLALADEQGWPCTTPRDPERRGGTVALDVPQGYEVSKALKARDIVCDFRPGAGVRLSPHFYTLDDELDAAVDAIAEILAGGAWRDYVGVHSTVT